MQLPPLRPTVSWLRLCLLGTAAFFWQPALANDAEVIFVLGVAEVRDNPQDTWRPIRVGQRLNAGQTIRTRAGSQTGLLLRDQTQIRVN